MVADRKHNVKVPPTSPGIQHLREDKQVLNIYLCVPWPGGGGSGGGGGDIGVVHDGSVQHYIELRSLVCTSTFILNFFISKQFTLLH